MAFDYSKNVKGKDEAAEALKLRQQAETSIKQSKKAEEAKKSAQTTTNKTVKPAQPTLLGKISKYLSKEERQKRQSELNKQFLGEKVATQVSKIDKTEPTKSDALLYGALKSSDITGIVERILPELDKQRGEIALKKFPVQGTIGQIGGYISPSSTGTKIVAPLIKPLEKASGNLLARTAEGALIGGGIGLSESALPVLKGEITPQQAGKNVLENVATGAVFDVGIGLIGKLAKPIADKMLSGKALTEAEKIVVSKTAKVPVSEVDTLIDQTVSAIKPSKLKAVAEDMEAPIVKPIVEAPQGVQTRVNVVPEVSMSKQQTIVKPLIEQAEAIPEQTVYRGYAISDNATERNLSKMLNPMELIGQTKQEVDLLPLEYYSTSKDAATAYANRDAMIVESIMKRTGKTKNEAIKSFEITYGKKPVLEGVVKEHKINPKKVLDFSDLGEKPTYNEIIEAILKAEGSPVPKYTKGENVNTPKWERWNQIENEIMSNMPSEDNIPIYMLMKSKGTNDTSGRNFVNWLKENGYDAVKYSEDNTQHYAVLTEPSIEKEIVKPLSYQDVVKPIKIDTGENLALQKAKGSIAESALPVKEIPSEIKVKLGEPDTKVAKVLTEMPTKKGIPFKEKLAKVYQETVSSDLPLERIGRANDKVTNLTSTLRKVGGSVDYNLETALTDIEGNEVGQSLFSIFKDVPKENKEDLFTYALHKHNLARYELGKPVLGETIDTNVSQQRLTELSTNPQLEAKVKEMNQYINGLMDNWALKSGLVNEDTLAQLRQMYPDYVPTYRNKDVTKPMIVGGTKGSVSNVIKKATGGSSDILPLDQQIAMLTNKVIRASRKNELYNSLYDTFESNPEFAERWFKPITKEGTDLTEGIDGIVDNFEEPIKKVGDTYELSFFRNGEKVKAEISKDLYDAIKPLSEVTGIENVAALVKKYGTNPFKSLITTYNPIFVVRNIMRDIPTAFIYSKDAVEWSKQMPIALKEIVSNGDAWKEYRALGGTRSGIFSYDKPTKIAFKGGNDNLAVKGAKGVLNGVETLNNVTETLPRFAEYLATVKKGGGTYESKLKGIMRASEITTDFSRSGKVTKTVDAFVPYLNPSVQGIDKFVRQVTERPLQTALKGGLTITVPTLILDQINKDDRAYQEMTEREKNQYYLIPDGEGKYTRIPKSREVGVVFSSLFDWIARRSRGEEVKPSEIASTIKENFTPVNIVENNLFAPLIKSIQQIKDPERDVKNYAGISIVPTGLKYYEPKEQYDAYTSEVGKQIGQIAGISPKVVDYLIRSYSGVLGQTLMPKISATQRGVLESAFKTDPVFKSGNVNDFYEELDKQTKELAKQKRDNPDRVDTALSKTVKMLNKTSRELSELRKEQKSIDQSNKNDEVKKKKIRDLQIQMNNITREALLKGGR